MRRLLARVGVVAVAVALLGGAAAWMADQAAFVTTSDARVRARMVTLSSEVAGRIAEMPITAGDRISRGQVLVHLDDSRARLELARAALELKSLQAATDRARLGAAIAEQLGKQRIAARESRLDAAAADLAAAQAILARAEADHARKASLHASGFVAQAAIERSAAELAIAQQATERAEAQALETRASLGEARAEARTAELADKDADALALSAHALQQRIALLKAELAQHLVASPLDGVIDEVFAEQGEHVAPGARLALAHAPDDIWLEANIKETDLPRIRIGAFVVIGLDASPVGCRGVVARIGDATTSELALVPNANPAGVFTKITQRVPVRIDVDSGCEGMRPGAMATLRIRSA